MAEKQEIEVIITEDGHVTYHIKGIKGSKCVDIGKAIASQLGTIESIEKTAEYYEQETNVKKKQNIKNL